MKKDRLTPRADRKKTNRSVSPQNVTSKGKAKIFFPTSRNLGKENQQSNSNEHSLQICLDLASYHKKEAEMLRQKNDLLQQKLKEEVKGMQTLHSELKNIKAHLNNNSSRKDMEALKIENSQLKSEQKVMEQQIVNLEKKIEQLIQQNLQLKNKSPQTESLLIESATKCENSDIKALTLAKQSRRQQYANRYQCFSFVPSSACLQCGRKDNQLEEARNKYSNELRHLQEQVNLLHRNQIAVQVMEKQIITKNQCIDYLLSELRSLENESSSILKNMTFLERKLQEITDENVFLRAQRIDRLDHSFSKTVA